METVIVAFERVQTALNVREILERAGLCTCLVCRSAAEVRRAVEVRRIAAVLCGYKFPDGSAQELCADLPSCPMLIIAPQALLDLCAHPSFYPLPAPVTRGALIRAVSALLKQNDRRPPLTDTDRAAIQAAKDLLIAQGMTEPQAHRTLQSRSMALGYPLSQTARMFLEKQACFPHLPHKDRR